MKTILLLSMNVAVFFVTLSTVPGISPADTIEGRSDNSPDWFYPAPVAEAKHNKPIVCRDTDSALGRYSVKTKELGLKDLARVHGHLCDGLVIAFIEINAVLQKLFPAGVVDRTDLRVVSKNGPCWVDAAAMMTGARINFQTLRIDNSIGDGFIIQRISSGEAYEVRLKPGVFPEEMAALERKIVSARLEAKPATKEDIDKLEEMAAALIRRLLNTPPQEILQITPRQDYEFRFSDLYGTRRDIINKDMPR